MDSKNFRIETDSLGTVNVPKDALFGSQTQRAVDNFKISGMTMPQSFLHALSLIKHAAAMANEDLKLLDEKTADHICKATQLLMDGKYMNEFPVDVFQTGSGTSTNMNMNEVISGICKKEFQASVHPNDHVNMSQSSNDVIPTAIHVSTSLELHNKLIPSIKHLMICINNRAIDYKDVTKTGRTHLMDAMPITVGQELKCWHDQLEQVVINLEHNLTQLQMLALGGTAVGTGINAHPKFAKIACKHLNQLTHLHFKPMDNLFRGISSQDIAVACSGTLKMLSVVLMKISNDLRWMNSGPITGLAEIELKAIQPGSSIMPGKVNPVIAEAVTMVAAEVMGNDTTITIAGQSGNFQLNVMLPLIANKLLFSIHILSNACMSLADNTIATFKVKEKHLQYLLNKNPILITALNPVIGYELGAKIAKEAYASGASLIDVAMKYTDLTKSELESILDPIKLTDGGLRS